MDVAEFRLRYDETYLVTAWRRHRRQLRWRGPYDLVRWGLAVVMGLLSGITVYFAARIPSIVLAGLTGALLGAILLGDPINAWLLKRRLRKSPFHNNNLVFQLTPNEIHVTGNNEDARLKWSAFSKARRFSDGLLLYQGPHFFTWLPDSGASNAESGAVARRLASSTVKDYRDV